MSDYSGKVFMISERNMNSGSWRTALASRASGICEDPLQVRAMCEGWDLRYFYFPPQPNWSHNVARNCIVPAERSARISMATLILAPLADPAAHMEAITDPRSTIDKEIEAFDTQPETAFAESAIRELISTYPDNQDVRHVLVKVIAINSLYHARVLDIDLQPLSVYITTIDELDARLIQGTPNVVDAIWKSQGTRRHYFSFATKFCSWHNQAAYAIYDLNVWEALVAYRALGESFGFRNSECRDYCGFLDVVKRFRNSYDLAEYSLKSIDKFLWRMGGRVIEEKRKTRAARQISRADGSDVQSAT